MYGGGAVSFYLMDVRGKVALKRVEEYLSEFGITCWYEDTTLVVDFKWFLLRNVPKHIEKRVGEFEVRPRIRKELENDIFC